MCADQFILLSKYLYDYTLHFNNKNCIINNNNNNVFIQVSVVVGKKILFLYNLQDPDNPIELAFQPRYGTIVTYKW